MKTQLIFRLSGLLLSMLLLTNSGLIAQEVDSVKALPLVTVSSGIAAVNQNVLKAFEKSFKNAEDVKWYKIDKDFLVKFILDDQQQSALFNKRGSLVYNITYGSEKHLPDDIRKQVKSVYFDYNIVKAISIREQQRVIWVINLEDPKSLILVRVEEGEMEEAKHFKKTM